MPRVSYLLALAVFALATSEFMLAGLVLEIADDLAVSPGAAGTLTSAFAVGMVIGAPLMAVLARRWPPRTALSAFLLVFVGAHVVGALTTSFGVLVGARIVSALANAGFLAVALGLVARLAAPERTARATAVLLAGTTVAVVVGVPGGAVLGNALGWRATFWAIALLCLPAVVAVLLSVPNTGSGQRPVPVGVELRVLRQPSLVNLLVFAALVNAATFCAYTYLAPLLIEVTGLTTAAIPVGLAVFGVGTVVGVGLAGRFADTRHRLITTLGTAALAVGWVTLALTAHSVGATFALLTMLGVLSFGVGSTVIGRAVVAASDAPTMAGAYATMAVNIGAAVGPALGGASLGWRWSALGPVLVAALLVVLAGAPATLGRAHR